MERSGLAVMIKVWMLREFVSEWYLIAIGSRCTFMRRMSDHRCMRFAAFVRCLNYLRESRSEFTSGIRR
jgi:hypothetical protein